MNLPIIPRRPLQGFLLGLGLALIFWGWTEAQGAAHTIAEFGALDSEMPGAGTAERVETLDWVTKEIRTSLRVFQGVVAGGVFLCVFALAGLRGNAPGQKALTSLRISETAVAKRLHKLLPFSRQIWRGLILALGVTLIFGGGIQLRESMARLRELKSLNWDQGTPFDSLFSESAATMPIESARSLWLRLVAAGIFFSVFAIVGLRGAPRQ